jgi:hypothetical protein
MNHDDAPICYTDLKPIRQSEIPTDEWVRPAPLVENDPSIFEEIAISLALGVVIVVTIAGFIIPL